MKILPLKHLITGTLLASTCLFTSSAAVAASAVSWGPSPDYVGGHSNGAGLVDGIVPFSYTIARNPALPYPNEQESGTYYGGAISDNSGGIAVWRVSNGPGGTNDAISFGSPLSAGERATALYLWKKENFLSGYNSGTVGITSFSTTLQHTGSGSLMAGNARWVLEVGGSYYVSDAFATTTSQAQYTLSALESVAWFSLNPSSSLTTIGERWGNPDFSNVSGVGLWYQLSATGTVSMGAGSIYQFEVTAIPEPAGVALTVGAILSGAVLLVRLRKHRGSHKAA